MTDKLTFDVVTMEKVVFSAEADVVSAPTKSGQISILKDHDDLVSIIEAGEIVIQSGSEKTSLATGGGFLEVRNNVVTILADSAEHPEDINVEKAELARQEALEIVRGKQSDDMNFDDALEALEHARIRLKVAKKDKE
ncbi:ATP synthase F1 subunit epsilon [Patescibacteria group bacterium]